MRAPLLLLLAAVVTLVVFVPTFFLVDRYPRRGFIRALRILGVVALVLIPVFVVWAFASSSAHLELRSGIALTVLILGGVALSFLRAANHGADVRALRPVGDPVQHWSGVLCDHSRWWIRSRAARELGGLDEDAKDAEVALRTALVDETNGRVRGAIGASLRRLQGAASGRVG